MIADHSALHQEKSADEKNYDPQEHDDAAASLRVAIKKLGL
jgi:hypothetical protein